ncbi:MAG: 8-oxoguanine deaminase, partial [Reinekea sp.]
MTQTIWIKNPRAVFTANAQDARGGILIRGTTIVELVALGAQPVAAVDQEFDATDLV